MRDLTTQVAEAEQWQRKHEDYHVRSDRKLDDMKDDIMSLLRDIRVQVGRNTQAIESNAQAIQSNAQAIGKLMKITARIDERTEESYTFADSNSAAIKEIKRILEERG